MRCKLGDISEITKLAGYEFTKYIKYIPDGEIIAVRALNLKNGALVLDDIQRISKEVSETLPRSQLHKNDIVLSYTGTLGECAQIREDGKYHLAPNVCKITPNDSVVNPNFLFQYIRCEKFKQTLINYAHGSTQPTIPMSTIRDIPVDIPDDLEKQGKIAAILSILDEKIAINRAINDNLADLLQTVYQERFGDTSLIANQGILSDICSYSRDKVAVSELNVSTYFSTENMLSGKAGSTEATSLPTTSQTTACHKGDTLISNIRPYFKKIVYCEDNCGCSTDVLCFTPSQPRYSAYLFSTLYADKFFAFMVAGSKGTKMPRGDKQQIMTYPVVLPSEEELAGFNTIASPLLEQIYSNSAENKRLSILRDTLLPKLMSGEIDVSAIQL